MTMTRDEKWLLEEKYSGAETPEYETDKKRLAKGEPLGYVIGYQPFLGLKIYLDSRPLIPRPETEWWTEQLLKKLRLEGEAERDSSLKESTRPSNPYRREPITFLDLCAGSGAIGCAALKSLPYMEVFFGEIDPAHEATIQKNIRENNLDASRTHISIGDLFEPFENQQFDIIAVNPPYIPAGRVLDKSVADYEPHQALYAGDDGLELIRRIALELPKCLAPRGEAWVEVDSPAVAKAAGLFVSEGLHAEIRTDQYSKPRIIVVSFP